MKIEYEEKFKDYLVPLPNFPVGRYRFIDV